MLLLGLPSGTPWQGLPSAHACLAAALQLFSQLLPGKVDSSACAKFCDSCRLEQEGAMDVASLPHEVFMDLALTWGFTAKLVQSAVNSVKGMAKNRPSVCCIFFESYVGVVT